MLPMSTQSLMPNLQTLLSSQLTLLKINSSHSTTSSDTQTPIFLPTQGDAPCLPEYPPPWPTTSEGPMHLAELKIPDFSPLSPPSPPLSRPYYGSIFSWVKTTHPDPLLPLQLQLHQSPHRPPQPQPLPLSLRWSIQLHSPLTGFLRPKPQSLSLGTEGSVRILSHTSPCTSPLFPLPLIRKNSPLPLPVYLALPSPGPRDGSTPPLELSTSSPSSTSSNSSKIPLVILIPMPLLKGTFTT